MTQYGPRAKQIAVDTLKALFPIAQPTQGSVCSHLSRAFILLNFMQRMGTAKRWKKLWLLCADLCKGKNISQKVNPLTAHCKPFSTFQSHEVSLPHKCSSQRGRLLFSLDFIYSWTTSIADLRWGSGTACSCCKRKQLWRPLPSLLQKWKVCWKQYFT